MDEADVASHLDALRRQLPAALRQAVRPKAYVGTAREVALGLFHLSAYPFGLRPPRPAVAGDPQISGRSEAAGLPVVLVHGYVHNRSAFLMMSRALKRAGFAHVHGFNYNPLRCTTAQTAADLSLEVDRLLAATGAERCMLVGHSMGGIVCRYYVQELGGDRLTDTVVTLGTAHRGTYSSYLGVGPAAAEMRPGSALLRALEEGARPSDVRWVSYYSDLDFMVTPAISGKLVHPALAATNVRVRDWGHTSMLISSEVLRSVVEYLANPALGRTVGVAPVTRLEPGRRTRRRRPHARTSGA